MTTSMANRRTPSQSFRKNLMQGAESALLRHVNYLFKLSFLTASIPLTNTTLCGTLKMYFARSCPLAANPCR